MAAPKKYPDELRARAVRLYLESDPKPVVRQLARQLGVNHETLCNWIRQAEADAGERTDRPTFDPAFRPGIRRTATAGAVRWAGYRWAGDYAVYVSDADRAVAQRVLDSVR